MQKKYMKYWCEECDETIHWTVEDFANKGEPICPNCDIDMCIIDE